MIVFSAFPLAAAAKCGTGNPISYNDISSVLLTDDYRTSDGYRDKTSPTSNLARSTFWLHFWETTGPGVHGKPLIFPTAYSQFTLRGSMGTFHLSATLAEARDILKRDDFYELSPQDHDVTETTWSVITVLRCAVVTRIRMISVPEYQEPAVAKLFADLENLIEHSVKTKVSDSATDFKPNLLFDP
jgi:hypothetical protein